MAVTRRALLPLICAGIIGARLVAAAPVLGVHDLRRLIVMEDRPVAAMAVEQVQWLGPGGMVVSGWHSWPDQPALVAFDAPATIPLALRPLHFFPRFVISPDGARLTFWHRVSDEMAGEAQLTSIDLATGTVTPLGTSRSFLSGGRLVTTGNGAIIAACQPEGGGTLLFKAERGQCEVLARFDGEICDDLIAEPDGDHVLMVCAAQPPKCYRINWRAGVWAEVDASLYSAAAPGSLPPSVVFDAAAGRIVRIVGGGERVLLVDNAEAACGLRDSNAIIYARDGALRVTDAAGEIDRELWGASGEPGAAASLLTWSPDGTYLGHCYRSGETGTVRRAALGTEAVKVHLSFPAGSAVKAGDSVWVAERFVFDARGNIAEPVWSTLKALLRVEQVMPAEQGKIAVAESVGTEGGVVERLTGSNDSPGGTVGTGHITIGAGTEPPASWMQTFVADPRENLACWVQGDAVTGKPMSVTVTRRRLMPLSP